MSGAGGGRRLPLVRLPVNGGQNGSVLFIWSSYPHIIIRVSGRDARPDGPISADYHRLSAFHIGQETESVIDCIQKRRLLTFPGWCGRLATVCAGRGKTILGGANLLDNAGQPGIVMLY